MMGLLFDPEVGHRALGRHVQDEVKYLLNAQREVLRSALMANLSSRSWVRPGSGFGLPRHALAS
jgi:uncharacterized protein YacL (UPF0231 family)